LPKLDTTKILFICGDTFVGFEGIVRRRIASKTIGFRADLSHRDPRSMSDLLVEVRPEDLQIMESTMLSVMYDVAS
jgi:ATP-dependent Clp protease ATP-binding subunit ClpX